MAVDAAAIVGLLAEPDRLRVAAALVLGAQTPAQVAAATSLPPRAVAAALRKLQGGGLVDEQLRLRIGLFKEAARASAPAEPTPGDVVARFVRDGRLLGFPAQHTARRQVLEAVVQSFEPGRHYPERQVDEVLQAWTDGGPADHVTLRRYLVDHDLLARDGGKYWRSGGPVEV